MARVNIAWEVLYWMDLPEGMGSNVGSSINCSGTVAHLVCSEAFGLIHTGILTVFNTSFNARFSSHGPCLPFVGLDQQVVGRKTGDGFNTWYALHIKDSWGSMCVGIWGYGFLFGLLVYHWDLRTVWNFQTVDPRSDWHSGFKTSEFEAFCELRTHNSTIYCSCLLHSCHRLDSNSGRVHPFLPSLSHSHFYLLLKLSS